MHSLKTFNLEKEKDSANNIAQHNQDKNLVHKIKTADNDSKDERFKLPEGVVITVREGSSWKLINSESGFLNLKQGTLIVEGDIPEMVL